MANPVRSYFNWPPSIMAKIVQTKCKFWFLEGSVYKKERPKSVRRTLYKVKIYQGFVENGEVYISKIIL